jgi:hypothetical protein
MIWMRYRPLGCKAKMCYTVRNVVVPAVVCVAHLVCRSRYITPFHFPAYLI